ncbi:MAG: DUF2157 domain-containing protein [Cytophagaceae bacterium]
MSREKEIKWLYHELPVLVEKGIIPEESASRLKEYYGPEPAKPHSNLVFVITSVLGALLIGAGIILLFGYNWENLSRTSRTVLSFLPLIVAQLIYGYAFFKKNESVAWIESSSAFLMLMLASTIALIGQTYNTNGTLKDFTFTWMLLSIPLMYILRSSLVCMLYLLGIASWVTMVYSSDIAVWYWAFLAAAIPHIALSIRPERTGIRSNILGWTFGLTSVVGMASVVGDFGGRYMVFGITLLLVLLYLLGKILFRNGQGIWSRPFQTITLFIISFYSLSLCYTWHLREYHKVNQSTIVVNAIIALLMFLGILFLVVYHIKKKTGINYFVLAFPVLLALGTLFYSENETSAPVILFNIYSLAFGIFYIWWGLKSEQISFVNAGMFFVSVLLLERFFDKDISFIIKGSIFIIIGIGFLTVNVVLMRKLKSVHEK